MKAFLMQVGFLLQPLPQWQGQMIFSGERLLQSWYVPFLLDTLWWHMECDEIAQHVLPHRGGGFRNVLRLKKLIALLINDLTLIIRHIIIFQQLLADVEVARLHLALSVFNGTCHPGMFNGFALWHI